jgi:hypothetical protein
MCIFSLAEPKSIEGATVIRADPLCPSLVAVMLADPAAAPDTLPTPLTVATDVLSDDHVTDPPATAFPFTSFVEAVAWMVLPIPTVEDSRETVTDATVGTPTVTTAELA